jgi:S-adenosyl methyltransferase
VDPSCRIVYVDNDPIVLVHARALLTSTPEGACAYIEADMRDPGKILSQAAVTLDFSQPVAIMLVAVLHMIKDDDNPWAIVSELLDNAAPGSYLAASHVASDIIKEASMAEGNRRYNESAAERSSCAAARR